MDFLKYIHVRADSPHFKMPWCEGVSPDQQRTILAYGALALSTFPEDFTMDDVWSILVEREKALNLPEFAWVQQSAARGRWVAAYATDEATSAAWAGFNDWDITHKNELHCMTTDLAGRVDNFPLKESIALDLEPNRRRFRHQVHNPASTQFDPVASMLESERAIESGCQAGSEDA